MPRTARFAVTRGGKNRSEWLEVDDAAGWPSRSVPRPRTSPPAHALALCVFGVPGVEHGKAALQQKLVIMEGVAANTGRELAEATVRSFLRRSAASS